MSNTLVGIVTFGNLDFTKLTVNSVLETAGDIISPRDILLIVGKPGDTDTASFAATMNIPHIVHNDNYGFPYSINDIYDFGWKTYNYDNIIIMGNDVIALPYSIKSLVGIANATNYEWVCGREISVKDLTKLYPETRKHFKGSDYVFSDFTAKPWSVLNNVFSTSYSSAGLSDVHNMALFKKSVMEKIGYVDVNFYPAYYEDNDYARRAMLADIRSCTAIHGLYFHFWSRTIKQGSGGSNNNYFDANKRFYITKWGGDFLQEGYKIPFNGSDYFIAGEKLETSINIRDRSYEHKAVKYWKK